MSITVLQQPEVKMWSKTTLLLFMKLKIGRQTLKWYNHRSVALKRQMLTKLAEFLENLPRGRFDLDDWAKTKDDAVGLDVNHCVTTGCVGGWSCVVFPRSGLKLVKPLNYNKEFFWNLVYKTKDGNTLYSLNGLMRMFDLCIDQTSYIFNPTYYPKGQRKNAKYAAKRIRKLVATPQGLPEELKEYY